MSTLIIRGATLKEIKGKCSAGGQFIMSAKFRAAWTDTVCKEMSWTEEPSGFGNGKLDGELLGINMIMEPSAKNLKDYRIDIPISKVSKFRHIAKTEDGEITHRELEYVVTTIFDDAPVLLSNYLKHCGPAEDAGQCRITFNAEEQQKLDIAPAEESGKQRGRRKGADAAVVQ
jgi:hypothetical protein